MLLQFSIIDYMTVCLYRANLIEYMTWICQQVDTNIASFKSDAKALV